MKLPISEFAFVFDLRSIGTVSEGSFGGGIVLESSNKFLAILPQVSSISRLGIINVIAFIDVSCNTKII